jgi:hypothetical protein
MVMIESSNPVHELCGTSHADKRQISSPSPNVPFIQVYSISPNVYGDLVAPTLKALMHL